jgi:hypothetical protein
MPARPIAWRTAPVSANGSPAFRRHLLREVRYGSRNHKTFMAGFFRS